MEKYFPNLLQQVGNSKIKKMSNVSFDTHLIEDRISLGTTSGGGCGLWTMNRRFNNWQAEQVE